MKNTGDIRVKGNRKRGWPKKQMAIIRQDIRVSGVGEYIVKNREEYRRNIRITDSTRVV